MPSDQEQAQLQQLSAAIGTYQHMPDVAWQMHPSYDSTCTRFEARQRPFQCVVRMKIREHPWRRHSNDTPGSLTRKNNKNSRVQSLDLHPRRLRVLPRHAVGVEAAVLPRRAAVLPELDPQHAPIL